MGKDKKRECIQKFLAFLYQIREKTNKEAIEIRDDVNNQKLKALTNKIIGDIEKLLEFYEFKKRE